MMAQPEKLMQIYSKDYAGGGVILALLVAGEGLHVIHAIFGTALAAAGEARKAAMVTMVSLIPALGLLILFTHAWGGAVERPDHPDKQRGPGCFGLAPVCHAHDQT
jgi:hypothetical protein